MRPMSGCRTPTVRGMDVEPIGSVPAPRAPRPTGVAAEIADARRQLRNTAPADSWDGVLAEVQRLQVMERIAPLEALKTVYAKLASGWLPPVSRPL
jgi:hypothetical protein